MNFKIPLLLFLLYATQFPVWAQSKKNQPDRASRVNLTPGEVAERYTPKITPPSPDAASLARYGDIPVELSKGIPSISVPLYEVQSGSLKVPISLSYHASGVKVNDVSSSVGLSWSLVAGGSITRAVNSLPDDYGRGFWTENPPAFNTNELMCYTGRLAAGDGTSMDGAPDYFFYNYPGGSGKIMYANKRRTVDQSLASFTPVTIPYRPIKISSANALGEYKITEIDGTVYHFGKQVNGKGAVEVTSSSSGSAFSYNSTWYLSHMVSPNRMDTVYFEYTDAVAVDAFPLYSTTLVKKDINGLSSTMDYQRSPTVNVYTNTRYPSAIYFKNGKVTFTYANRDDLPGAKRLTAIYVYRKDNGGTYSELKHFDLEQSYFTCQDESASQFDREPVGNHTTIKSYILKRLKLDKITEKSAGGVALPPHQFGYYYDPQTGKLPMYGTYGQDYYGYYNGKTSNRNLLVYDTDGSRTQPPAITYGADRSVDFNFTVLGALKEITYPTGGKSTFVYEAPVTAGSGTSTLGGGLRIKSITNTEGSTQLTKKTYSYPGAYLIGNLTPANTAGIGQAFNLQEQVPNGSGASFDTYTFSSWQENYTFMLGGNSGSSIAYTQVEVSQVDGTGNPLGKTVSNFTSSTDGTPSTFPFVTIPNEWRRGQLLEEKDLNASGNTLKHIKNYYREVLTDSLVRGFASRTTYKAAENAGSNSYCTPYDSQAKVEDAWTFTNMDYQVGAIFLDSTITFTYNETGGSGLKEKQVFTFAAATHHQLTKKLTVSSKNQDRQTLYRYPHDFPANSDYAEMVNRHIYAPVIEEETKSGTVTTSLVRTNYKKWFTSSTYSDVQGFFAPLSIEAQFEGGPISPQIVFGEKLSAPTQSGYDASAHPILYTTANGTVTSMSWWNEQGKRDLVNTQTVNNAFTTTYDYNPLIGVKSMTDPVGKVMYYEYDAFGRLSTVRNDNASGSLRKSFCYNYAGQTTPCTAIAATGAMTPPTLSLLPDYKEPAMPVTLVDFVAVKEENAALLTWKTSEEISSAYFEIQKSQNGRNWKPIGRIEAKTDSKIMQYYSFRDMAPYGGQNLYRLKMVDLDASFAYSRIEQLHFENAVTVYPNPLTNAEKLKLHSGELKNVTFVRIFNVLGKTVYSGKPASDGIDLSILPAGTYLVQITEGNGNVSSHKVIKN